MAPTPLAGRHAADLSGEELGRVPASLQATQMLGCGWHASGLDGFHCERVSDRGPPQTLELAAVQTYTGGIGASERRGCSHGSGTSSLGVQGPKRKGLVMVTRSILSTRAALVAALLFILLAALMLAACGGSGSPASSSPSATSSIPSFGDVMTSTPAPDAAALPAPTVAGAIGFGRFVKTAKGYNSEIFTVRTDGTGLRQLTDDPWWEEAPSSSPDGRRIAYSVWTEDDARTSGVWVMSADGAARRSWRKRGWAAGVRSGRQTAGRSHS